MHYYERQIWDQFQVVGLGRLGVSLLGLAPCRPVVFSWEVCHLEMGLTHGKLLARGVCHKAPEQVQEILAH